MPMLAILVADMIASRERLGRPALADRVADVLDTCNRRFADSLSAPVKLTRGVDEMSGAFARAEHAFDYVTRVNLSLHPTRFRFVLSWGEVDVNPDADDAALMDGPAFHQAAARIDDMKAVDGETPVFAAVSDRPTDTHALELVSALGNMHQQWIETLKPKTIEALRHYYDHHPNDAPPVHDGLKAALGVETRQAVQDALKRGRYHTLARAESAIRRWLAQADAR